eukprot:jgi/Picre1/32815/NNA_008145.t1
MSTPCHKNLWLRLKMQKKRLKVGKSAQEEVMQLRELAAQDSSALKSHHADALQKKIDALVTEREAMERAKDEALALANKAKDSARTALADKDLLSKELDEKVVSFASLKAKYDSLEASKRASDAQFEALCAKLNAAHSVAQMNEANAQAMAGTASKAEMDASQLLKRLEATQERCDAAELSMEGLRAQLESTQEELKAKCEEHNQLSNAFEEATTKMAALSVDGVKRMRRKMLHCQRMPCWRRKYLFWKRTLPAGMQQLKI